MAVNEARSRSPRLISSRSARVSRPRPGCHGSDRIGRFDSRRTTVRTTSCEQLTCRATLRKTVASFLDDAQVSTRKISDQLGHAQVSMTQDRYLGRRLTDRQTADVLEEIRGGDAADQRKVSE